MQLVVFDWNGTLIADAMANCDATNAVLRMLGAKPITVQRMRDTFRLPISDFYEDIVGDKGYVLEKTSDIVKVFNAHYEPRVANVRTRRGARQVLAFLRKRNIRMIILSNHTARDIEKHTDRLGITHYFHAILAHDTEDRPITERSKQGRLERYLQEHKIRAKDAIIVGDTEEEAEIANNVGMPSVLIRGGSQSSVRWKDENPDYVITNLVQLKQIITRLSSKKRRAGRT